MRYFIDANIFLEVQLGDKRKEECIKFFRRLQEGEVTATISDFIIYTSLIQIDVNLKSAKVMKDFILFVKSLEDLEIFRPDIETIMKAIGFAKKYNLDFDDALVVSSMLANKIKKLVSFDKDFDKVREIERIEPNQI